MSNSQTKNFFFKANEFDDLATGYGACLATDMITVEGCQVIFMWREAPEEDVDSGWRFTAGIESQEYVDDPNNLGWYDVNTIANIDPDIIPFLDAPIGSAFERKDGIGEFVESHDSPLADEPSSGRAKDA